MIEHKVSIKDCDHTPSKQPSIFHLLQVKTQIRLRNLRYTLPINRSLSPTVEPWDPFTRLNHRCSLSIQFILLCSFVAFQ